MRAVERDDVSLLGVPFIDWLQLSNYDCNQLRSPGVRFGKRAVVGAVRVFEPIPGLRFFLVGRRFSQNTRIRNLT